MNNFFSKLFTRTEQHISDDHLIALLDGELSVPLSRKLNRHLEHCWDCRARHEQMQAGIVQVVGYRKQIAAPFMPPPPAGRDKFLARLDEALRKPRFSWTSYFRPTFLRRMNSAVAAMAAVAVAVVIVVWRMESPKVPTVSASELLMRAEQSRSDALGAVRQPVLHQKVRIQIGQKSTAREIWHDAVHGRTKESWDRTAASYKKTSPIVDALSEEKLAKFFSANHLIWDDPLSPAGYAQWRAAAGPVTDEITRCANEWTVKTYTVTKRATGQGMRGAFIPESRTGRIVAASLTVRASDFHPLAEQFQVEFPGASSLQHEEVDIAEVQYAVVTAESLTLDFFNAKPPAVPFHAAKSFIPERPIVPARPSLAELADVEVAARYALHRVGADLGAPVNLRMDTQQKPAAIVIEGLVNTEEQKQELLQALSGMPYVKADLKTEEEAASQSVPAVQDAVPSSEVKQVNVHSPMEKQLFQYLGSSEAVDRFSEQVLVITESLTKHASALHELGQRYPKLESQTDLPVSATSHELLAEMARDYRSAMREKVTQLDGLLKPVLLMVASSHVNITEEASLFGAAERTKQLTLHLLFGADLPEADVGSSQPGQAAWELLAVLQRLETQLKSGE